MDRNSQLLAFIPAGGHGIEIGAWFAPLVPKRDGWRTLVLDVLPRDRLRAMALASPYPAAVAGVELIEEVDLLGSASELAGLCDAAGVPPGSLDFVVSSHNFEHLPDPVRFLQGVERMLKPGGVLSMAIPDKRTCFDTLRPETSLGQLLEAHLLGRRQPTPAQVFDFLTGRAYRLLPDGTQADYFPLGEPAPGVVVSRAGLAEQFAEFKAQLAAPDDRYKEVHPWAFTPAQLHLLLAELRLLGLTGLVVERISPNAGIEFYVHLRRPAEPAPPPDEAERAALLRAFVAERTPPPRRPAAFRRLRRLVPAPLRSLLRAMLRKVRPA